MQIKLFDVRTFSLSGSHGAASLRAVNPEGSILNNTSSQDNLSPVRKQDSHDVTKSPGSGKSQLKTPPPTPEYKSDLDLLSDDFDSMYYLSSLLLKSLKYIYYLYVFCTFSSGLS